MKKIYVIPTLQFTKIHCEKLIMQSIIYNENQTTSTQYVKEDVSNRGNAYNVWDDDWSK